MENTNVFRIFFTYYRSLCKDRAGQRLALRELRMTAHSKPLKVNRQGFFSSDWFKKHFDCGINGLVKKSKDQMIVCSFKGNHSKPFSLLDFKNSATTPKITLMGWTEPKSGTWMRFNYQQKAMDVFYMSTWIVFRLREEAPFAGSIRLEAIKETDKGGVPQGAYMIVSHYWGTDFTGPRMMRLCGDYLLYLSQDGTLCSLDLGENPFLKAQFDGVIMFIAPPSSGLVYLFTSNPEKEIIIFNTLSLVRTFVEAYDQPEMEVVKINRRKDMLRNTTFGIGKIRDSRNFPKELGRITGMVNDESNILAFFSLDDGDRNVVSFLNRHPLSEDRKTGLTYDLCDYAREHHAFKALNVPYSASGSSPIFHGVLVQSRSTVRCAVLVERYQVHLVYFAYTGKFRTAGFLSASMSLPDTGYINGCSELDPKSLAVFGVEGCCELTLNF